MDVFLTIHYACSAKIDAAIDRTQQHTSPDRERAPVLLPGQASFELGSSFRVLTLEVISQVVLGLVPSDAAVFPLLFEAVLDELNARLFAPWRAFFLPAARSE